MSNFDENRKYNKTNWKTGDELTADKLNKIEDGIEAMEGMVAEVEADLEGLHTKDEELSTQLEQKIHVYNTVQDMKNDVNIKINSKCKTLGYRSAGDGGGGYYVITNDTPNGCNIIKISDDISAKLIVENVANFKQLGGNGWSNVDTLSEYFSNLDEAKSIYPFVTTLETSINNVILKVALDVFKDIYFPTGVYYFNDIISIPQNKKISGAGMKQTYLKQTSTLQFITLNGSNIEMCDMNIVSEQNNPADYGIVINANYNFNLFENIYIQYFKNGIRVNTNCFVTDFNNVTVLNCDDIGIDIADHNNILNLNNCKINECGIGVQCIQARNINITKSWIELCNLGIVKTNQGNLNVVDTYFERNTESCIKINWGTQSPEMVIIRGCSFFTNENNSIINFHAQKTAIISVENCYFIEYDTDDTITSNVFKKGSTTTSVKPVIKNCYLTGGISLGLTDEEYTTS